MDAGSLIDRTQRQDGAEGDHGLFGAVLRAGSSGAAAYLPSGDKLIVGSLEDARSILTRPDDFTMPFNVSRRPVSGRRRDTREKATTILSPDAVSRGRRVFIDELAAAASTLRGDETGAASLDVLAFLRDPVARSTTAALCADISGTHRNQVAERALAWIDSLGPVISALRPPRRWSRVRRAEQHAQRALTKALRDLEIPDPSAVGTALAAGIQVPIAAGAWCVTLLASQPDLCARVRSDPDLVAPFVWEVLRLYPPTWLLPRIATRDVAIGSTVVPAYTPVIVSPAVLGRAPQLVPGPENGHAPLEVLDPDRWRTDGHRPGSWLPFGAGPHACPGRNLGMAQLTELVTWAAGLNLAGSFPEVDATRGLVPSPSVVHVHGRGA